MADTDNCVFVLGNSLAAVSACDNGNALAVTDGFENNIYMYSRSGVQNGVFSALRPYRRLRYDPVSDGYTAVACCGGDRIYLLGSDLSENGFVKLDIRSCIGNDEITDVCVTRSGSESYYTAAFERSAYLFDLSGKPITKLCDFSGRVTDFISPTPEFRAAVEDIGGSSLISVYNNGKISSAAVPKGLSPRMLYNIGETVYGLFGRAYIYNVIRTVYFGGSMIMTADRACE